MHCRFLELSLLSENVLASLDFYRALGFAELATIDAREHPYAVVSDGRACIGLHNREFASPSVSFVLQNVARTLAGSAPVGLSPVYTRFGDDDFHEAGFVDPEGHAVTFVEARTFSPPDLGAHDTSLLGYFEGLALPSRDPAAGIECWERLGFVALDDPDEAPNGVTLTSDALNLILHPQLQPREPVMVFSGPDIEARIAMLKQRSIDFELELPGEQGVYLRTPEGLLIRLMPGD